VRRNILGHAVLYENPNKTLGYNLRADLVLEVRRDLGFGKHERMAGSHMQYNSVRNRFPHAHSSGIRHVAFLVRIR